MASSEFHDGGLVAVAPCVVAGAYDMASWQVRKQRAGADPY